MQLTDINQMLTEIISFDDLQTEECNLPRDEVNESTLRNS